VSTASRVTAQDGTSDVSQRHCSRAAGLALAAFMIPAALAASASAGIEGFRALTRQARLYETVEWSVSLRESWQDPYQHTDVALDLFLVAPSGRTLAVPCYYDSGRSGSLSTWKARFAPQEVGRYSYFFRLTRLGRQAAVSRDDSLEVEPATGRGFLHAADAWTFRFDDGERFRGIGENLCWEARTKDDSKFFAALHENPRFNFDELVPSLARNGGNFFRVWLSPWSLPLESPRPRNTNRYQDSDQHFNPSSFQRLDQLTSLAEAQGVYFMLTLSGGWDLDRYSAREGGPAPTREAFFSDPMARARYKSRLRYLVARWGASPSIAAWELWNEVDNVSHNRADVVLIPHADVVAWHAEMSAYLEAIDPYGRPVTTSISHREIPGLDDIASIDFNQRHVYRHTDAIPEILRGSLEQHAKPEVIGEFAFHWDWSLDFSEMAEDFDHDFKRGLWYGLFSPTPVLPMSWWWEFFDERKMTPYLARVRTILDHMMAAGKGAFAPVAVAASAPGLRVMGVRCGRTAYIYLLNDTKQTVLTDLAAPLPDAASVDVRLYSPESGTFASLGRVSPGTAGLQVENATLRIRDIELPARGDVVIVLGP
jgi:hypothetical protein